MKKMLLVSMFQNVAKILRTVEPNLKGKTVTFIPTASKVERLGFFVNIGKWKLRSMSLIADELEISTAPYETIKNKLERNDFIYVTGGNTFYLLRELRRTGADELLVNEVNKGKLYIGESAGAIVVAPDIGYSSAMDSVEKAQGLKDYKGLNLIDFYVVPHKNNWELGKAANEIENIYSAKLDLKVIGDNQAIWVLENQVTVLNQ